MAAKQEETKGEENARLTVSIEDSAPIGYMHRTQTYYAALGYDEAYHWAQNDHIPFARLGVPLSKCKIALVTTAALYQPDKGDQGPGARYNGAAKFHQAYSHPIKGAPDMRISHIAYDRQHTSAEDVNTWFPLAQLKQAAAHGKIGGLVKRFYGMPTTRSIKTTLEKDCPNLLSLMDEDKADAALLVANCPVCHQTTTLAARHLEENGIPTVVMGCAKDVVEHAGAPRFLFSDFPLGNSAGRPHDPASQVLTLNLALDLIETATKPGTTIQSPLKWTGDPEWKRDYCNIDRLSQEEIAALRNDFDLQKQIAKTERTNISALEATKP